MAQAASGKSASFGGKRDMISSSFNEVHKNKIWRELLGRESKQLHINDQFHLDPKTLVPIAAKPTEVTPADFEVSKMNRDDAGDDLAHELQDKISAHARGPTSKFEYPMTASQEIGWMAEQRGRDQVNRTKRWQVPLSTCEVTQYAQAYVATFQKNPFAVRGKPGTDKK